MKKKLLCEKGSTMVLLVMAVGVISLLGTSILGVTMMNYKIKKTNTDLKSSFYMAETGLDRAYERAYTLLLEAVNEGNKDAQELVNNVTAEITELNEEEHDTLPIVEGGYKGYNYSNFIDFDMEYIARPDDVMLKEGTESIFKESFEGYLNSERIENNLDSDSKSYDTGLIVDVAGSEWDDVPEEDAVKRELTIEINSTYTSNVSRSTSVDLVIGIPDYTEPYTVDTATVPIHRLWTYGLAADNIEVNGSFSSYINDAVKISGDAYADGNLELNGANIGVYFGRTLAAAGRDADKEGILVNGAGSSLKTNDVYTKNIIMSKNNTSFTTDADSEIYVKDDMEMNNSGQTVDIDGSYCGFGRGGEVFAPNTLNSALIINSPDIASGGSKFNITGDLTLYGTSYIKNTDYATGESVSIPGNYIAYTRPLSGGTSDGRSLAWDNIETIYREPLPPLAYRFKSESIDMQVWNKADYFEQYNKPGEYGGLGLNLGGGHITVGGTVKTLGLAIDGTEIVPSGYSLGGFDSTEISEDYNSKTENYYEKDGFGGRVSANQRSPEPGSELLYISDGGITITDGEYGGYTRTRGLIVTNGDVTINGEFNFTGTIIAGGDIIINAEEGEQVSITHNINYLAKLIAENSLDESLFAGGDAGQFSVTTYKDSSSADVDFKQNLNFKNWKIK